MTARERMRMQIVQALTRSDSPEVRSHLRAALDEYEDFPPAELVECPLCGKVGLIERICMHECDAPDSLR
jgi:ribosomal protein L32